MFFISGKSTEGGPVDLPEMVSQPFDLNGQMVDLPFVPKRRKALQTLGCSFMKTRCKVKFLSSTLVQLINYISCIYSQRSN